MIDISRLNRADVLRTLYDNAKPQGMGFLHFTPEPMTGEEAEKLVEEYEYFDYLHGRVMKVSLPQDAVELDPRLYDRDNGEGAAQRALEPLLNDV